MSKQEFRQVKVGITPTVLVSQGKKVYASCSITSGPSNADHLVVEVLQDTQAHLENT